MWPPRRKTKKEKQLEERKGGRERAHTILETENGKTDRDGDGDRERRKKKRFTETYIYRCPMKKLWGKVTVWVNARERVDGHCDSSTRS